MNEIENKWIANLMVLLEVLGQNKFEPASVADLVAVTDLDQTFVESAMNALNDLGYVRKTPFGFQCSEISVRKFDYRSPVYDQYLAQAFV